MCLVFLWSPTVVHQGRNIKQLFERHAGWVSILSDPGGTHSLGDSIERLFDLAARPAAGSVRLRGGPAMSLLVEEDQVGGHAPAGARLPARSRRRAGEPRRPPTRARVVAGRRRGVAPDCAPRRVPPRWPWLAAAAV